MQSSVKVGRFGLSVLLLGRSSTGSSFSARTSHDPHCLCHLIPLCTTILAVSRLLSSANLMVADPLGHRFGKLRRLVVNQSKDHKGLGLRHWFFRYSFATIFLDLGFWRGFSCGSFRLDAPTGQAGRDSPPALSRAFACSLLFHRDGRKLVGGANDFHG